MSIGEKWKETDDRFKTHMTEISKQMNTDWSKMVQENIRKMPPDQQKKFFEEQDAMKLAETKRKEEEENIKKERGIYYADLATKKKNIEQAIENLRNMLSRESENKANRQNSIIKARVSSHEKTKYGDAIQVLVCRDEHVLFQSVNGLDSFLIPIYTLDQAGRTQSLNEYMITPHDNLDNPPEPFSSILKTIIHGWIPIFEFRDTIVDWKHGTRVFSIQMDDYQDRDTFSYKMVWVSEKKKAFGYSKRNVEIKSRIKERVIEFFVKTNQETQEKGPYMLDKIQDLIAHIKKNFEFQFKLHTQYNTQILRISELLEKYGS